MIEQLTPAQEYTLASRNYVLRSVIEECLAYLQSNDGNKTLIMRRMQDALAGRALTIEEDANRALPNR